MRIGFLTFALAFILSASHKPGLHVVASDSRRHLTEKPTTKNLSTPPFGAVQANALLPRETHVSATHLSASARTASTNESHSRFAPESLKVTLEPVKATPESLKVAPESLKVTPDPLKVTPESPKVAPEPLKVTPEPLKVTPESLQNGKDEVYPHRSARINRSNKVRALQSPSETPTEEPLAQVVPALELLPPPPEFPFPPYDLCPQLWNTDNTFAPSELIGSVQSSFELSEALGKLQEGSRALVNLDPDKEYVPETLTLGRGVQVTVECNGARLSADILLSSNLVQMGANSVLLLWQCNFGEVDSNPFTGNLSLPLVEDRCVGLHPLALHGLSALISSLIWLFETPKHFSELGCSIFSIHFAVSKAIVCFFFILIVQTCLYVSQVTICVGDLTDA